MPTSLRRPHLFVIATVAFLALMTRDARAASPRKPNVIVLLADDLGYADLSLHGNKEVATSNIDSLAKDGVRCTSGYVSCPYCSPTRAGLLTGRYQQRFGHEFNPALLKNKGSGQGLPTDELTIADRLRTAGYATALVGKWHQGEEPQFHPQARGFGEFFGFLTGAHSFLETDDPNFGPIQRGRERVELDGYLTDVLAREAVGFIERHRERPFFLYLAFNAVHTPMHAPADAEKPFANIADPTRRTYLAMLAKLDTAVGTVLTKVRELKLEEDTLVFFFSDNGGPTVKFSANGSRNTPLRGSKGDTWEGGIRVPFLVRWPGHLPAGKVYDHPVISLDVTATTLAVAGVAPDTNAKLDGVNLVPHLAGQAKAAPHDALFWRFGSQMAIRRGDWKLVRASLGDKEYVDVPKQALLFNVTEDIGEQRDLATQHPDKVRELQTAWNRWNAELASPRWPATLKGKPIVLEP
jgi:arylsulfatase A-like enzyme